MNFFTTKGRINGKWSNKLTGTKRGLNVLIVDEAATYKTSFWQEDADKIDAEMNVGDEVYLFGHVGGLWRNKDKKPVGIVIVDPEIQLMNSSIDLKSDLINRLNQSSFITRTNDYAMYERETEALQTQEEEDQNV